MSPEKWQKIKELFNEAVELPFDRREIFLKNLTDEDVSAELRKLLAAEEKNELTESIVNFSHLWQTDEAEEFIGKEIGGYKILREIGRGGMGIVFEAVRETEDFSQKAALKILRRGPDSEALLRRFRRERQILASLENPNIARMLDGGRSAEGTPFFAMEFVEGKPLDEFCAEKDLSINEHLRIFLQVCAAVSFAHSRLVVHRDLKPSNIFVTGDGTVKLLDFGIAKILSPENDLQNQTVTQIGMMTPQYASPEQIKGEIVSTSSDIYSLGLILYELLTGVSAYDFPSNRPDEMAKIICETEPARPSSVVADTFPKTRKNTDQIGRRTTNPKSKLENQKSLRGDLDTIILKALRKEPARRYISVEQFAGDIKRHLEGLPVIARPDTISYRLEKFVKRNQVYVMAGALVFFTLAGGIALASRQAYRAEQQQILAERRFNQVRELANKIVFNYHDGIANLQGSTEIRKLLVNDATQYLDNLSRDADRDVELQRELANAYVKLADVQGKTYYSNIGDTAGAIENYRKAILILEKLTASDNRDIHAKAVDDLISAYQTLGMMQSRIFAHDESINSQIKALRLVEEKAVSSPDDINVQYQLVKANGRYADSLREGGEFEKSMEIYRQTLAFDEELYRKAPNNENIETAVSVLRDRIGTNLAYRAIELKRIGAASEVYNPIFGESEILIRKMFKGFENLAAAHPENKKYKRDLSTAYGNLGMLLRETGRLEESRKILEEDLAKRTKVAEKDFADRESQADLSEALWNLAQTKAAQKEFVAAFSDFKRAVEIYDKLIADDRVNLEFRRLRFEATNYYADALLQNKNPESAIQMYQTAYNLLRKDAPETPYFVYAEGVLNEKLGNCYASSNNEKAHQAFQKTLENWGTKQIQKKYLSRTPERLDFLKQKIKNSDKSGR